jgi:hypothetical protein
MNTYIEILIQRKKRQACSGKELCLIKKSQKNHALIGLQNNTFEGFSSFMTYLEYFCTCTQKFKKIYIWIET